MNHKVWISLLLLISIFSFNSCSEPEEGFDAVQQWKNEVAAIDSRIANETGLIVKDTSGVRMVIDQLGTGLPASFYTNSEVEVDYVGMLMDGTVFDDGTALGKINSYIDGWKIALTTLPVGSVATLYIPSYYGYRNTQQGTIPPNSTLVFDITFTKIIPTATQKEQFTKDTTAIEKYLTDNSIEAVTDPSGIRYVIHEAGTGAIPSWYNKVDLTYSFKSYVDGSTIETYESETLRVVDFINGIQAGLQKLPGGSKATLYIPSTLAFGGNTITGKSAQTIVSPNTNVMIEIESLTVK